ncbi:SPW repeat protein [Pontibacter silvestris]|uniref:SPW repeat protein n=1 Tax=Pontibacter silvestris TaxID=2305183 RepID=A0ABW4WSM6_9BACT|nr:SPW repeat protein [Pontibacter silvestris]MCC9136156.1 SPW repeat protein [Pontibacter silvestris]
MRFIPTRFHGILDYIYGALLVASPWLFGFSDVTYATWTAVIVGVVVLMQAIITDYEVGVIKKMPMQTHLMLDFGIGVLLALSPWIFGFAEDVYAPHLIFGIVSILTSLTTHRVPSRAYKTEHASHRNDIR